MTTLTRSTSIPRPKISVATRIRFSNALKDEYRLILCIAKGRLRLTKAADYWGEKLALNVPFGLLQTRVNGDTWEIAILEQFVQLGGPRHRLDEDADLARRFV
jgi:hypothetical protein